MSLFSSNTCVHEEMLFHVVALVIQDCSISGLKEFVDDEFKNCVCYASYLLVIFVLKFKQYSVLEMWHYTCKYNRRKILVFVVRKKLYEYQLCQIYTTSESQCSFPFFGTSRERNVTLYRLTKVFM